MSENTEFYNTLFLNKYAKQITEIKNMIAEAVAQGINYVSFRINPDDEFVYDVMYEYFRVMGKVTYDKYTDNVTITLKVPERLDFSNSNEEEE